jgi:hypothetical protein
MIPNNWTISMTKHLHYINRMKMIKEDKYKRTYECKLCGKIKEIYNTHYEE